MTRVVLLGAGGHARVVADILLRAHQAGSRLRPVGFLDDDPGLAGAAVMGLPVLGAIGQLDDIDHDAVIVATGDNHTRASIFEHLRARGKQVINAIHPAAVLASDVRLGDGVMICAGVVVNTGAVIGDNVILNTGCTVDHDSHIGPHGHVAPGSHLGGNVHLGAGALVGIGAAVLPGRSIGEWAVVGAGSVVTRDVPPRSTAVGVPARVIKRPEPQWQEA